MADIDDRAAEGPGSEGGAGDYSYDLVHEEIPAPVRGPARAHRARGGEETEPRTSGDYSYDLVHEVPPPRGS